MSDSTRCPVLLIHGIDDTGAIFEKMTATLEGLGWPVHSIDLLPSSGYVGLDRLAEQIETYVSRTFEPNQAINLVGFSMGGIVSRYYVQRLGGIQRVQRLVTISSPHNGTWTALLRSNIGASQMRINSSFLRELNRDLHQLGQLNFTSIWTPFDSMIVPARSSELPIGKSVQVRVGGHAWMVTDPGCILALAAALAEPIRASQDSELARTP